jgi:hypothetical protein
MKAQASKIRHCFNGAGYSLRQEPWGKNLAVAHPLDF